MIFLEERKGRIVAECTVLERRHTARYRGFESLSFRTIKPPYTLGRFYCMMDWDSSGIRRAWGECPMNFIDSEIARIMTKPILKFVLAFQGAYYVLTGFWAIVALNHFAKFTGLHSGAIEIADRFEMISMAALATVIGVFFIVSALRENLLRPAGFLALGVALAIIIPELIYLPQIGNPLLFWIDFAEESVVALLLVSVVFR